MRRAASALAAVLAVLLVSGCAPETRSDWAPASWHTVGTVTTDLPATSDADAPTVAMRLRNDTVGLDARWAILPGDHPANAVIEHVVRDAVAGRVEATGAAYHPEVFPAGAGLGTRGCAPGETTRTASDILAGRAGAVVVCEITAARGPLFAETLRTIVGEGGTVTSDRTDVVYADLATGAVGTGDDLFTDTAALWTTTVDTVRRYMGSLSLAAVAAPDDAQLSAFRAALSGARFAEGALYVPVAADLRASELDGLVRWQARGEERPLYVRFTAEEIASSLTDLGREVLEASGPFTGAASAGAGFEHMPCDLVPCMAMTLDDGPSTLTPTFLDVLRDEQSAATFFMLGKNAERHPDTVARVAAEGHEIGNHTWDHAYLTDLTDARVQAELGDTRALLQRLSGQAIPFFRPPGGFVNDHVIVLAGQSAILWSVDTRDWAGPAAADLARYAIDTPRPGTIMLMHDIQAVTQSVFHDVVTGLRDRGFQLVTIDGLFGGAVPSGQVRHGPIP